MIQSDTNDSITQGIDHHGLEIESVTKRFPGVVALDDVSLRIMPGETLAVIGENGAGKSTLMKVLAGIQSPDSGTIRLADRNTGIPIAVTFRSPGAAIAAGISLIHQELNLHENLSVAENIYLGREPSHMGWLDRRSMAAQAQEHLQRVGLDVSPHASLATLSTAARQLWKSPKHFPPGRRGDHGRTDQQPEYDGGGTTCSMSCKRSETTVSASSIFRIDSAKSIRFADRVEVMRDGKNAGIRYSGRKSITIQWSRRWSDARWIDSTIDRRTRPVKYG